MYPNGRPSRVFLEDIARRAMATRGLQAEFSAAALAQADALAGPAPLDGARDLRALPWCSIDNDDSRDLDQLTVAEALPGGAVRVLVAVADVAAVVAPGSPIDAHAEWNTTSVYTPAAIFPMLPERLSTDLTSLALGADRRAIVIALTFDAAGQARGADVFAAAVHNRAKLGYPGVAAWLEGAAPLPAEIERVPGLAENLQMQDRIAQSLRLSRFERGALTLESVHARPVFEGANLRGLSAERTNRAKALIQDLMIAANAATAEFLARQGRPSIRRIVRTPKNWDRIVALAAEHGASLPAQPDGRALSAFLVRARAADPVRFPDLSLSVVKLIGKGEYVVGPPSGPQADGHFGLAVQGYSHATAPNRQFSDLITQRLVKAALAGVPAPYSSERLAALALRCTQQEDAAKKVERQLEKSAAAMVLAPRVGELFAAIVTGAADKGCWVRVLNPPAEGKLVGPRARPEVGQRLQVRLVHVDVERGFLDFE